MTLKVVISAAVLSGMTVGVTFSPSYAAIRKPANRSTEAPAESAQCKKLRSDYDGASKRLALARSKESMDDSAVRSTMRNTEATNTIEQARMTLDIMKGLKCALPDYVPSADRYGLESLRCGSALQRQRASNIYAKLSNSAHSYETPVECDTSLWIDSSG